MIANVSPGRVGDGDPKSHGRWRLNSGSEMLQAIKGVSAEEKDGSLSPVRVVLDLASARFANDRITALSAHETGSKDIIGYWDRGDISSRGVEMDLHLIDTSDDSNKLLFQEAARLGALIKAGVPVEVSVSAEPADASGWEKVEAGKSIQLNARNYSGDGELPLYVLRNARIYEASIVTFGADSQTGRVAATRNPPVMKEKPMAETSLSKAGCEALQAKYPARKALVAALYIEHSGDAAKVHDGVRAAEMDERDDEIKALKAAMAKQDEVIKCLKAEKESQESETEKNDEEVEEKAGAKAAKLHAAKLAELVEHVEAVNKEIAVLKAAKGAVQTIAHKDRQESGDAPKTVTAAMQAEIAAGSTLRGIKLREHVLAKNPKLVRA